jgi:hypothetical protein
MSNEEENIDFSEVEEVQDESEELTVSDFQGGNYLKNPPVGESIEFEVEKVVNNKNTKGKNSQTGKEFDIGVKNKAGEVKRYDIHTNQGIYTVKNWEIFFKLFGKDGLLITYANEHNKSFKGAKLKITKLLDGSHANTKIEDLMKIKDLSKEETEKYQQTIKTAIKESRLYEVTLE